MFQLAYAFPVVAPQMCNKVQISIFIIGAAFIIIIWACSGTTVNKVRHSVCLKCYINDTVYNLWFMGASSMSMLYYSYGIVFCFYRGPLEINVVNVRRT